MRIRPALLVLVALHVALPARAEHPSAEWQRLEREAADLAGKRGEGDRKLKLIYEVTQEDSARVAHLLLSLAVATDERQDRIAKDLEKAQEDYEKIHRKLVKRYGRKTTSALLAQDAEWRRCREAVDTLTSDRETEASVLTALLEAIGALRSPEAAAMLMNTSDGVVRQALTSLAVRGATLDALSAQPVEQVVATMLAFAQDEQVPLARARALDWIGAHKVEKGFDAAVASLRAKQSAVARAAVAALLALDDPRCVYRMIEARQRAGGLLAEEIELALHAFTGESYFGAGADTMWMRWWRGKGDAWLKAASAERFSTVDVTRSGSAEFYGITTRSNRIVFVLDRSQSMREPVPQPRGPTTGHSEKERVPGETRLEVAKNQLARTIRALQPDVKFAVVFYSHDVHLWRDPPGLMPATTENRKEAIDWVMDLEPVGSTRIFDALGQALRYAEVDGKADPMGADTIFLLSDGAPSTPDGTALVTGEELEAEIRTFLEANRAFHCVVHTIGVGPEHNRELMQRLARETSGTYKAVGMN